MGILPPHHGNDFGLEPPGHNKENEDDVEAMSTDSSSSSSDSDWVCVRVFIRGLSYQKERKLSLNGLVSVIIMRM